MIRNIVIVVALAFIIAAGTAFASPGMSASAPEPAKTPSVKAESGEAVELSGKVVETMDAGGYTYVCLEKAGVKTWVAVPQTKVTKGAKMSFLPGQTMHHFESKTLNRTFDTIVFSGGPAEGQGRQQVGPVGSKAQVGAKDKTIKIEKAQGPNGLTVSEAYAQRVKLNGKQIAVRGKVVKVSKGIMNRNWVHLQDGTGDQQKGTHNLVATTQDAPEVGDTVTAAGTFVKDKDFGAGYLYKAIIEDATIEK